MRNALTLIALLTVFALALTGCSGTNSNPVAPHTEEDLVPPAAPLNLSVEAHGSKLVLTWSTNVESDLSHYTVYRLSANGQWESMGSALTSSYYDQINGSGPHRLQYRVSASDLSGNESGYSASFEILIDCDSGTDSRDIRPF